MNLVLLFLLTLPGFSARAATLPEGAFEKPCALFEEDDYVTAKLALGPDGQFWRSRTGYEEETCATPWIQFEEEGKVLRFEGEELDLRFLRASYRPLTEEVAEALRLAAFCGITDWRAKELREVTGLECGDYPIPARNATVYTRAKLEGTGVRLGQEEPDFDGSRQGKRHRRLESQPYGASKR